MRIYISLNSTYLARSPQVAPFSISPGWLVSDCCCALIIVKLEAKRMTAIAIAVKVSPMVVDDLETKKGEDTPKMPI